MADKKSVSQSSSSRSSRDPSVSSTQRTTSTQPQAQAQPASSASNHVKRRRTLDEELRRAGDQLWAEGDEEDDVDLDNGLLVGVGSKSTRKGFLSGGGAAGLPVFMGPGYVDGAEDDEAPPRVRSRSSSRNRR